MKTKQTKIATRILRFSIVIAFIFICQISEAQIINTIAGDSIQGFSGDGGQATAAELGKPLGVAVDAFGNIYFTDTQNHRIRKVNSSGVISTIAGNGMTGYSGDYGPATEAEITEPYGIAVDDTGNVYFSDNTDNCIRKINTSGVINTIAGNIVTAGYSGDGGPATAAQLNAPMGLYIDAFGNIYFADYRNNCIRKINTSGIISTIVGNGTAGYSGDGGQATAAELNGPSGVTLDDSGNIYIADANNNLIRKVNTSGVISSFAGTGTSGFSGDRGVATLARLNVPMSVYADASGNIYIADYNNVRIRKVNISGIISTVAGTGIYGFSGDGGSATSAKIGWPYAVTIGANGNMYIADTWNNRIRKVTGLTGINELSDAKQISVYPNPSNGIFTIAQKNNFEPLKVEVYNMLGEKIFFSTFNS
ncbi:MAG TPA: T9SS type A sorting domain-containing protein [Bacteroidia bacterium]|nr:T9SS type A sorting domain-containing protein [Bacteroidia bacterium]